jgi:hypothetical protein
MNKEELIELVKSLNMPNGEYYILSSGCLLLYGLRDKANDLDICITQNLFEEFKNRYNLTDADKNECGFYKISDKVEAVVTGKYAFEYDIKDGYPVQKLESILESKRNSERPKDIVDAQNILEYFKNHSNN